MVAYQVYADELERYLRGEAMTGALELLETMGRLRGGLDALTGALEPFEAWPDAVVGQGSLHHLASTLDGDAVACHTRVMNAVTLGDEVVQAVREGDRTMMETADRALAWTDLDHRVGLY